MRLAHPTKGSAFTLIELLMVIAIIALLAGLIVGLNSVAGDKARISTATVERDRLVTLIEAYKLKIGVYPPQNPDPNEPGKNTLVYELAGAFRNRSAPYSDANPNYETPFGSIRGDDLNTKFGIPGIINASDDPTEIKRFLKNLKPNQYDTNANTRRLVIAIDDPNGDRPNYWNYRVGTNNLGTNIIHNPETFDLWVDIKARGQTKRTIGNWKD